MNRIIQKDYEKLLSYFSDYNLKNIIEDTSFQNSVKSIHRKLYAYIVFKNEAVSKHFFSSDIVETYYSEVGSDLILSLFCWTNGAYKSSEFQLRSAIENFFKAILYSEKNDIIFCKNVSEIMDFATNSTIFSNDICQSHLNKIKNTYSNLCAFVHSSPEKLSSQDALIQLPKYNQISADEFTKNYHTVVNGILSIIYYTYYTFIFSMHPTNRDLFLQGLTTLDKKKIYEEKTKDK